jgi:glycosyltransferase involved in cell wall biosynthesis
MVSVEKINLLFVLIQVAMGGTERIVLDLARKIDRTRFNIYLAYFNDGAMKKAFEEICQGIFRIQKRSGLDPFAMQKISNIIKENHIDVINAHHYLPFFYSFPGSRILHRRKLIYTEHSVFEVETILSSKHKKILSLMMPHTNSVIGISREIGETFKNAYPKYSDKIRVIINGVDVDRFNTPVERDRLRSDWGISPGHFVIVTVANFRRVKNHVCLIKALKQLSTTYPQVRVLLVGQGFAQDDENSEGQVRDLINKFGLQEKVIFTGFQNDIPSLLKISDVFCLPSFSEGLPVGVLEAMAAKIPVVGSDVKGINEIVFQDNTGLLFTSNDENALAHAFERLIKDTTLRGLLSNNAYEYVCKEHGLLQWVAAYECLFES